MLRLLRSLSVAALVCLPFGLDSLGLESASAKPGEDCRQTSLKHLRASSPGGFAIYKQVSEPDFFASWINCDDAQFDLSTAVHESTHQISAATDAFPLVGGGAIQRPHEVSAFFPPTQIAKKFKSDDFTTIYLRLGKASSSTDFLYLLDELNAYTHDLETAVDLKHLSVAGESIDHRDGLAALMAFVAVYAETAKAGEPGSREAQTWSGLQAPHAARTISVLLGRAERVMSSSCGIPNFGTEDKRYIRRYCAAEARSALAPILGRAPLCPTACLQPTPDDVEQASTTDETPTGTMPRKPAKNRSTAAPSWFRAMIRSLPGANDPGTDDASTMDEAR